MKNNKVGGYPVWVVGVDEFCHEFVTLDPKNRYQKTIIDNI